VKFWLKVVSTVALGFAVAIGGLPLSGGTPQTAVASEPTPQLAHAATNGRVIVGAGTDGRLWWSEGGGQTGTWVNSGADLSKNGVTSLIWTGRMFVATSFFASARSTDGKNWTIRVFPLGQRFDPGNIISDEDFFRAGTMTAEQIQRFFDNRAPACRSGFVCLNTYTERTFDRERTVLCNEYKGAKRETAAQIIAKVSQACGVSAEVLIVLIQKEQGLVTHPNPNQARYDRATGYACPDTAPCDARFFGFYNQVYNAAKQFKRYANPPGTSRFFTWFPVGRESQVRWHPNVACGTSPVTVRNQATAGLYYYTPYQPNQPAMANLTGLGDSCSAYGNRNFWRLYNYWFNPTKEFGTYLTTRDGQVFAVDGDGVIAQSSDGVNWLRVGQIPGVGGNNRVAEFGLTDRGRFGVVTTRGEGFQSKDLNRWSSLTVTKSEQPQTFVTTHTVRAGDTVTAIARANSVTVSHVVDENKLPNNGNTIFVGQQLTITKQGTVSQFQSPIQPHSSAVPLSTFGQGAPAPVAPPATSEPAPDAEPPADQTPAPESGEAPGQEPAQEPAPQTPVESSQRVLQPLVTQKAETDRVYVVRRGDTLIRIATRNGHSVRTVADWNNIRNVNRIFIGQRLIVGKDSSQQSFHRVEAGDTVDVIAQLRGTTTARVLSLNPNLRQNSTLEVGSLVRVG
jgi:LysM repeat protein